MSDPRLLAAAEKTIADQLREIERLRSERDVHHQATLKAMEYANRLRTALESIAKNTCCDKCQEAALVAREALREGGDKPPAFNNRTGSS